MLDLCCGSGDLAFILSEKVGSNGKVSFYFFLNPFLCLLDLSYCVFVNLFIHRNGEQFLVEICR